MRSQAVERTAELRPTLPASESTAHPFEGREEVMITLTRSSGGSARLAESKDRQEATKTMSAAPETATRYPHIDTSAGVPVIAGSTMKVVELVMAQRAHGWSPEELHFQFPHLSMAQIHAALGFYWDHRSELDADIDRRKQVTDELRPTLENPALARKLRGLRSEA